MIGEEELIRETHDQSWLNYSDLDQNKFTVSLSAFSLISSFMTHPLNVITTRQQAGSAITGDPHHSAVVTPSTTSATGTTSSSTITAAKSNQNVGADLLRSYHTLGLRGLFRGWAPIAIVGLPSNVIYLTTNEYAREQIQTFLKQHAPSLSPTIRDGFQSFATSVVANGISLIPYVPADVISARMIVQSKHGLGMRAMIKQVYQENGVKGFFKGFQASFLFATIFSAQWWWIYSVTRRECQEQIQSVADNPMLLDVVAGLTAGVVTTGTLHPLDTIKTKIMTSASNDKNSSGTYSTNVFRTFRDVVKKEGSHALWRGLRASMSQTVVSSTGFAIMYEVIKRFCTDQSNEKKTTE